MDPIAFEIFGLQIRWYGILLSSAILIGIFLSMYLAEKNHFDSEKLLDLVLIMIPAAIVGARIYYVIFRWDYYSNNLNEIYKIWHGGLAIHGGIIGGIIVSIIYTKKRNLSFWELSDFIAPSLILGQAIGRWGNFFNQEAYGRETNLPWAITVNDPTKGIIHVHPTFLYESLWDFCVFLFLLWYGRNRKKVDGEVFILYIILYSIGRLFIESLRIDSLMFMGIRVAQLVSILAIIIAVIIFKYFRKSV